MDKIGCIVMASGLSRRYGKNKLMEMLAGKQVILHTVQHLVEAGYDPLVVTRSPEVRELLGQKEIVCILHEMPLKSDAMHIALDFLGDGYAGYLFMQGDQPIVLPSTLKGMGETFLRKEGHALRLSFGGKSGSPVIFPAFCREALLAYEGDQGGREILKNVPCDPYEACFAWELWDVDTPLKMEEVRRIYRIQEKL